MKKWTDRWISRKIDISIITQKKTKTNIDTITNTNIDLDINNGINIKI